MTGLPDMLHSLFSVPNVCVVDSGSLPQYIPLLGNLSTAMDIISWDLSVC